jgi:hypothetical protein
MILLNMLMHYHEERFVMCRKETKRNETTLHFASFRFDRFRFVQFRFVSFRTLQVSSFDSGFSTNEILELTIFN